MIKYRIIPTNISFGKQAKYYIKNKIALPLSSHNVCFKEFTIETSEKNTQKTYSVSKPDQWKNSYLSIKSIHNMIANISKIPKTFMGMNDKNYYIMGILNVTPDSFSENYNEIPSLSDCIKKAETMCEEGADIIDIGGESSRPGASNIDVKEEQRRIISIIKELSKRKITISCDTKNASTMEKAIDAGAQIINDISSLKDKKSAEIISKNKVGVVLMHMQGNPQTMQQNPNYNNVSLEITNYLELKRKFALNNGIKENNILLDPGIGFGKNDYHNIKIFRDLSMLHSLNSNIMIGASRKSMIGRLTNSSVDQRLPSSLALAISAVEKGVKFLRVHDVKETLQSLTMWNHLNYIENK